MVTVGTRLRIIRKDAGLSQVELGKLAEAINPQSIVMKQTGLQCPIAC